jgi:hypothetical protein
MRRRRGPESTASPPRVVEALETPFDNSRHTAAKAETTGYARAFRRADD